MPDFSKVTLQDFTTALNAFVQDIEGLRSSFPIMLRSLERNENKTRTAFYKSMHIDLENPIPKSKEDFFTHSYQDFTRKAWLHFQFARSTELIPRSFLVSLVSQYDAFLGRLIKAVFNTKPELLNASDRQLTFSDLAKFGSIDEARSHLIEKEVETVLRKSHKEQFEWFENKLSLDVSGLRKQLYSWPQFIELTERRNLFVHNDAKATAYYIEVCTSHGCDVSTITPGDMLVMDAAYFSAASRCVLEIGIKLANVVWRKLKPKDSHYADSKLKEIVLHLILSEDYPLVIELLEFVLRTPPFTKNSHESHVLDCKLNLAQSYKWSGREAECSKIVDEIDWSAKSPMYLLYRYVLKDDFKAAARTMEQIGRDSELRDAYSFWPIFSSFRDSPFFLETYAKVYGQSFYEFEQQRAEKAESFHQKAWWKVFEGKGKKHQQKKCSE